MNTSFSTPNQIHGHKFMENWIEYKEKRLETTVGCGGEQMSGSFLTLHMNQQELCQGSFL